MKEKTKQRIIFAVCMVFTCLVIGSAVGVLQYLKYRGEFMPESLTQAGISQRLQTGSVFVNLEDGSFDLPGDQALVSYLQIGQWEQLEKQEPQGTAAVCLRPSDGYTLEFYEDGLVAASDDYTEVGAKTVYYRCPAEIDGILEYLGEQKN